MRLIDANDFLDLFYVASAGQDKAFVETVEMVVEDTPTIDAVPVVRGRWIEHEIPDEPLYGTDYECSVCGKFHHDNWNYCPDCGADMRGDGDV